MRLWLWKLLSRKVTRVCLGCEGEPYKVEHLGKYIHQTCCKLCNGTGQIVCYEMPSKGKV